LSTNGFLNPQVAGSARDRFKVIDLAPQTLLLRLLLSAVLSGREAPPSRRQRIPGSGISTRGGKASAGHADAQIDELIRPNERFMDEIAEWMPRSASPHPIIVHRFAVSLHASFPRSVALTQLRFTSFAVVGLREDFQLQDCAHAGRT